MNYSKIPLNKPIKYQYLTRLNVCSYAESASAKSDVGIRTPQLRGALAPVIGAFLYLAFLWWSAAGSLRAGRLPLSGSSNLLHSAAISFEPFGGGYLIRFKGEASC